jgi:hypothetical protein
MTRDQRFRYEMFQRVQGFGGAHRAHFASAATAGQAFADVAAAVTTIEAQLQRREVARINASRVRASNRAELAADMKDLARTARRVTKGESTPCPFVMPARRTVSALLTTARMFIDEARPREAGFIAFGLPIDFIRELEALVNRLDAAAVVRNNGRAWRREAQTAIERAFVDGMDAVRNLDAMVPNVLRADVVSLGHWRGARRIEGLRGRHRRADTRPAAAATS